MRPCAANSCSYNSSPREIEGRSVRQSVRAEGSFVAVNRNLPFGFRTRATLSIKIRWLSTGRMKIKPQAITASKVRLKKADSSTGLHSTGVFGNSLRNFETRVGDASTPLTVNPSCSNVCEIGIPYPHPTSSTVAPAASPFAHSRTIRGPMLTVRAREKCSAMASYPFDLSRIELLKEINRKTEPHLSRYYHEVTFGDSFLWFLQFPVFPLLSY